MPSEISISAYDLFDGRTIEEIVVQLAAFRTEPGAFLREPAKIEIATITVIKKDSVGGALLQAEIKRNCLIDWIAAHSIARSI